MSDYKMVYSTGTGKPWKGIKPNSRRKLNTGKKKGK